MKSCTGLIVAHLLTLFLPVCFELMYVVSTAPVGISSADPKTSPSISTVISLLSTLCRGSPSITHDLLRSQLPEATEKALQGDER
jgi:hypothetical protein